MLAKEPVAELHEQFSSEGATLTPSAEAARRLEKAEVIRRLFEPPDAFRRLPAREQIRFRNVMLAAVTGARAAASSRSEGPRSN